MDRPAWPASILRIHARDNVAVALRALEAGEEIASPTGDLRVQESVRRGHKIALRAIPAGAPVHKYGWPIGRARTDIPAGSSVHTHNLESLLRGEESYEWTDRAPLAFAKPELRFGGARSGAQSTVAPERCGPEGPRSTFQGYRRAGGRVGVRNEIWILPTVGCVARTAEKIARRGAERFAGCVDGVFAFAHPFGCSQLGDDLDRTRALIAALATHPNAGGVLLVGLGCESNQLGPLIASMRGAEAARVRSFAAQGVEDEVEAGVEALEALVAIAENDRRETVPLSTLTLGLKCGGSDGFSGLTANPLVGAASDWVTAAGGAAILTEVPEIFGAERILMARAAERAVFDDLVSLMNGFKRYFLDHGQRVDENPSPGNKEGGITTLEEKSLGAVQKAGAAPVSQVLRYGEQVRGPGLAVLEAPGNDAVSSTALAAAGAAIILFTTGRGTPLGFPAPTIKISSNSALAAKKPHWIDFDAGRLLDGVDRETAARDLQNLIVETASGRATRNERNDEREIAIWKSGVTL